MKPSKTSCITTESFSINVHNNSLSQMQGKIYHIALPFSAEDSDDEDTSRVEPNASEDSESDWVEVGERAWSEEALIDDARPGQRKVVGKEKADSDRGQEQKENKKEIRRSAERE
jgi:hypothetical protein